MGATTSHKFTDGHRFFRKIGAPLFFVAPVWGIGIGAFVSAGSFDVLALFVGLGIPAVLHFAWILRNYAEEVVVSREGLDARTLTGHRVSMNWHEIAVIEEMRRGPRGRRLRLSAVPDRRRIVLTEPLSDFDKLEDAVRIRAERAKWTEQSGLSASLFYQE
jgi:hypothetical protein